MSELRCNKCGKQFTKKYNYSVHLNRKFPCDNIACKTQSKSHILRPTDEGENIKCPNCDAMFSRNSSLQRHLNNKCVIVQKEKEDEETRQMILNEILEEMAQIKQNDSNMYGEISLIKDKCVKLEEENKELKDKMNQIENVKPGNTTYINSQVNNITNIQLSAFGKESFEQIISDECCKYILFRGFEAVHTLLKYVYFNKKKPEYHNCYISNTRDNHAITYDGIKWNLVDLQETIDTLRTTSNDYLEDKFTEFDGTLSEQTNTKFGRYLQEKESKQVLKRYKETIKLLLYNNKEMIIQTRQEHEKNNKMKQIKKN